MMLEAQYAKIQHLTVVRYDTTTVILCHPNTKPLKSNMFQRRLDIIYNKWLDTNHGLAMFHTESINNILQFLHSLPSRSEGKNKIKEIGINTESAKAVRPKPKMEMAKIVASI